MQPIISCTKRILIGPKLYHASHNLVSAIPLGNHSEILLQTLYLNCFRFELNDKSFYFFFLIVCLFVCNVDHGVNEGEPADEQYCEQVNEDQFHDLEPERQCFDQDFPEGYEDGKFNPAL